MRTPSVSWVGTKGALTAYLAHVFSSKSSTSRYNEEGGKGEDMYQTAEKDLALYTLETHVSFISSIYLSSNASITN